MTVGAAPVERGSANGATTAHDPVVSVIIPTWNRAHLMERVIATVQGQTLTELEILIVDDGSTDGTAGVIGAIDEPRIRYIPLDRNGGSGYARNRGLREARGEFVAFLDSDDEWFPEKLRLQVDRIRELPDSVVAIYTGTETINGTGDPEYFTPSLRGDLRTPLLERNVLHGGGSSMLIRRSAAERVGAFDLDYPAIEDYDYWLRLSAVGEIDFVPDVLVRYHDAASEGRKSRSLERTTRARDVFFAKHSAAMRQAGIAHRFLEESARRLLRRANWQPARARELLRRAAAEHRYTRDSVLLLAKSFIPGPAWNFWVNRTRRFWGP